MENLTLDLLLQKAYCGRCDSAVRSLFQNFLLEFAGFAEFESLDTRRCCQILRCRV